MTQNRLNTYSQTDFTASWQRWVGVVNNLGDGAIILEIAQYHNNPTVYVNLTLPNAEDFRNEHGCHISAHPGFRTHSLSTALTVVEQLLDYIDSILPTGEIENAEQYQQSREQIFRKAMELQFYV